MMRNWEYSCLVGFIVISSIIARSTILANHPSFADFPTSAAIRDPASSPALSPGRTACPTDESTQSDALLLQAGPLDSQTKPRLGYFLKRHFEPRSLCRHRWSHAP